MRGQVDGRPGVSTAAGQGGSRGQGGDEFMGTVGNLWDGLVSNVLPSELPHLGGDLHAAAVVGAGGALHQACSSSSGGQGRRQRAAGRR